MKTIFTLFSIIIFSLVFVNVAKACSCISPSLDSAIEESSNIVILKLQSVEKYKDGEKGYGYDGIKQSKLTVEKVFKGKLKVGQELNFAQGGGADCIWTFNEEIIGVEFLFFLSDKPSKDNLWRGFVCSRSGSLKGVAADLMYLEKLNKVKGKTRLSGTLSQEIKPSIEGQKGEYKRLAKHTVTITGNGKNIKLKTDENGIYEIYDLPVGKYKITPEKVNGFKFNKEGFAEVEINKESLEEQDFEFEIDNSVSGNFYDSNGKPLQGVWLKLIPTKGKVAPFTYLSDTTDEDGYFKFDEIPIGTYLIVVNEENIITARQPFETFYYPNKTNREEATEITVGPGTHLSNLIITAPSTAETITVKGTLFYSDGKPVVDEWIYFFQKSDKIRGKYDSGDSQTTTDKKGQFELKILKGQKGNLFGSFSTYEGKYENCPKMDKIIKEKGETFVDIETESKFIEAENDLFDIVLTFPFPSCKKAN